MRALPETLKTRDRKLLVCHDIPAGHCEEKVVNAYLENSNPYRFNWWAQTDIFVYFGHYTVTIPPVSWIEVAHISSTRILGTLIFEWEAGAKQAELFLND